MCFHVNLPGCTSIANHLHTSRLPFQVVLHGDGTLNEPLRLAPYEGAFFLAGLWQEIPKGKKERKVSGLSFTFLAGKSMVSFLLGVKIGDFLFFLGNFSRKQILVESCLNRPLAIWNQQSTVDCFILHLGQVDFRITQGRVIEYTFPSQRFLNQSH